MTRVGRKVLTFRTNRTDASDGPGYTYTSVDIGQADASRRVIVGATGQGAAARTIQSITVGGVAATEVVYVAGSTRSAAIWVAHVPVGATTDIEVVWNQSPARCSIGVWTATGLTSSAAIDTDSGTGNPASATLDTAPGGFAIAMYGNANAGTVAWTNATERFDASVEGDTSSGADAATSGSNLTLEANHSNSNPTARCMVAASW